MECGQGTVEYKPDRSSYTTADLTDLLTNFPGESRVHPPETRVDKMGDETSKGDEVKRTIEGMAMEVNDETVLYNQRESNDQSSTNPLGFGPKSIVNGNEDSQKLTTEVNMKVGPGKGPPRQTREDFLRDFLFPDGLETGIEAVMARSYNKHFNGPKIDENETEEEGKVREYRLKKAWKLKLIWGQLHRKKVHDKDRWRFLKQKVAIQKQAEKRRFNTSKRLNLSFPMNRLHKLKLKGFNERSLAEDKEQAKLREAMKQAKLPSNEIEIITISDDDDESREANRASARLQKCSRCLCRNQNKEKIKKNEVNVIQINDEFDKTLSSEKRDSNDKLEGKNSSNPVGLGTKKNKNLDKSLPAAIEETSTVIDKDDEPRPPFIQYLYDHRYDRIGNRSSIKSQSDKPQERPNRLDFLERVLFSDEIFPGNPRNWSGIVNKQSNGLVKTDETLPSVSTKSRKISEQLEMKSKEKLSSCQPGKRIRSPSPKPSPNVSEVGSPVVVTDPFSPTKHLAKKHKTIG